MPKDYVNTTNVLTQEDIVANYISILTMLLRSYDDVTVCVCVCVCVSYDMRPGEKREISRLISIEALAFTGHLPESFKNDSVKHTQ